MTQYLWLICALITAISWGFGYALSEKLMKDAFSPIFIMVVSGFFYFTLSLILAFFTKQLEPGFQIISEDKTKLIGICILSISYVVGTGLIFYAISLKNATLVNLIEITYPVFTVIFAYVLMKEVQINLGTLIGGLLIFAGVATIFLKS